MGMRGESGPFGPMGKAGLPVSSLISYTTTFPFYLKVNNSIIMDSGIINLTQYFL